MSANLNNIVLDLHAATGSTLPPFLARVQDNGEYVDKRPTGRRLGTKYTIACPASGFNLITVKVTDVEPIISSERLDSLNANGQYVRVAFKDFVGKMRQDFSTKEITLSATASSIEIVDAKEVK